MLGNDSAPDDPTDISITSISGDFNNAPWHIAIDDSLTFFWQKQYGKTSTGSLTPILFPNDNAVIVGGFTTASSSPTDGLLAQSQFTIGGGAFTCGTETNAEFQPIDLTSEPIGTPAEILSLSPANWWVADGTLLEPMLGCPD